MVVSVGRLRVLDRVRGGGHSIVSGSREVRLGNAVVGEVGCC
jgi:hypothetical protein